MKLRIIIWFIIALSVTGCYPDDLFETNKDAFYKLYGNGTIQEAVAMEFSEEGDIYLIGNQEVRNQDSSAVVIIRADPEGNQRWSARHFGKGYTTAKAVIVLPSGELLLLAASRPHDQFAMEPVLYRLDAAGNLLEEYYPEPADNSKNATLSNMPVDMVMDEAGAVFVLGNVKNMAGVAQRAYIKKIDLQSVRLLDQREFSNADMTEGKRILWKEDQLLVIGDTRQETGEMVNQNIFIASFSTHLVEAGHTVMGGPQSDSFHKAIFSSLREFVMLSSEQDTGTGKTRGVVSFVNTATLDSRNAVYLEHKGREIPEAIAEDEEGNFYVALTSLGERNNTSILISKIDPSGNPLWDSPKEIGGEGNHRIVQISMKDGYVYLLKTIDMQNENRLISLSKIRL